MSRATPLIFLAILSVAAGCGPERRRDTGTGGDETGATTGDTATGDTQSDTGSGTSDTVDTDDTGEDSTGEETGGTDTGTGTGDETDETDDSGTDDLPPGDPRIQVSVGGAVVGPSSDSDLPTIPPGTGGSASIPMVISNVGGTPLVVTKVDLASLNEDGTPKCEWVSLDFGDTLPAEAVPVTLEPGGEDTLELAVAYAPMSLDPNDATLEIQSDDPDDPVVVVRFLSPPIEPRIRIEPPLFTFESASLTVAETVTFEIHNDGLAPLTVAQVVLETESEGFVLEPPKAGVIVTPQGTATWKPASFTVTYQPVFGTMPETAVIKATSNDPTNSPALVPLDTTFATSPDTTPCLFGYESEGLGYLDMGDAIAGLQVRTITGQNVGDAPCTLDGLALGGDLAAIWYSVHVDDVPSANAAFPISFGKGETIEIDVGYLAPGFSVNADLTIDFSDIEPRVKVVPIHGSGPAPCLEVAPGSLAAPLPIQFVGQKFTNIERSLVIYNCGEGTLALTGTTAWDLLSPGDGSEYWAVLNSLPPYKVFPPGAIEVVELAMYVSDSATETSGVLELGYVDSDGETSVSVSLEGLVQDPSSLPTADPGTADDYPDLLAGTPFQLDGLGSADLTPPPDPDGYIWFLLEKPAGSALVVNGPAGPPEKLVTPDLAGSYTFGLIVRTLGAAPLYSEVSEVAVSVGAPPEEADPDDGT